MNSKSFRVAKAAILKALSEGNYQHELRAGLPGEVNLLQSGDVEADFVSGLISACGGQDVDCTEHHLRRGIWVWICKAPRLSDGSRWYVKYYFDRQACAWFIAVHTSARGQEGKR